MAVLACLVAPAGGAACAGTDRAGSTSLPAAPSSTSVTTPAGVETTHLDAGPVGLAAVGGQVWAALPDAGDVRAGDDRRVAVGDAPLRLVDTPAGVWVSVIRDGAVVRIDPATGTVDLRVRLRPAGSEPEGLAYDGSTLWVVDQAHDRLVPIDPDTGHPGTPVRVGAAPRLVSAGASGLWVGNYGDGSVSRVVPRAGGATVRTVSAEPCITPQGLAEAAGVVWVACTVDGKVVGLDARTLEPVTTLANLPAADAVVADGDTVYVVGQQGPTVWTIDAPSRRLTGTLVLGDAHQTQENVAAALVQSRLLVSHPEQQSLYAIPRRLLTAG